MGHLESAQSGAARGKAIEQEFVNSVDSTDVAVLKLLEADRVRLKGQIETLQTDLDRGIEIGRTLKDEKLKAIHLTLGRETTEEINKLKLELADVEKRITEAAGGTAH